jgi:SAM-dependent methyltransferase
MTNFDRKKHWENIYQTKELKDVSWYQPHPETSLTFIQEFNIPTSASIIDVGGGDSFLVDYLLDLGFSNVSVLDISEAALDRAKKRLGKKANLVKWIVADAANFKPLEKYDFWHDRAAFHFLTAESDIQNYMQTVSEYLTEGGIFVVGTFSETGPTKCSGIDIKQYSENSMSKRLSAHFEKIKCVVVDHKTPSEKIQNFVFCSFKKPKK